MKSSGRIRILSQTSVHRRTQKFVVAARIPSIERAFGLDVLFRFHRSMGLTAFALIFSHPGVPLLSLFCLKTAEALVSRLRRLSFL